VLSAVGSFDESERGKALPQFKQNPAVSSFAVPQFGQYIFASPVLNVQTQAESITSVANGNPQGQDITGTSVSNGPSRSFVTSVARIGS